MDDVIITLYPPYIALTSDVALLHASVDKCKRHDQHNHKLYSSWQKRLSSGMKCLEGMIPHRYQVQYPTHNNHQAKMAQMANGITSACGISDATRFLLAKGITNFTDATAIPRMKQLLEETQETSTDPTASAPTPNYYLGDGCTPNAMPYGPMATWSQNPAPPMPIATTHIAKS